MPEYTRIRHVLVVGSGPVPAWPAGRALRAIGMRVAVADPNPATIMVDPAFADTTYTTPITPAGLARVIAADRPDGLLVTPGGPAAVDSALTLHHQGVLRRYGAALLDVDPVTYRPRDPVAGPCVEVETVSDRHGRVAVLGAVEYGDDVVVPAPSATAAMRRQAVAAIRSAGFGVGCAAVRFVGGRLTALAPGVTRASALAAAACGVPLAETVALLAVGGDLPTPHHIGERVLVAVGDRVGAGTTILAARNNAGHSCLPDELRERIELAPVLDADVLRDATRAGLDDDRIAALRPELADAAGVRHVRERLGLLSHPIALTTDDAAPAVLILGPAPDEPPEFAHACANAAIALGRAGHRVRTVGLGRADGDYLVPPRLTDLLGVVRATRCAGVLASMGGPTAARLGAELAAAGVPVIGLSTVEHPAEVAPPDAMTVHVTALYDGHHLFLGAIGESIDPGRPAAGHIVPAPSIGPRTLTSLRRETLRVARHHGVPGPLYARFGLVADRVVTESVTLGATPHLAIAAAATGVALAQAAARLLLGASIPGLRADGLLPPTDPVRSNQTAVWLPDGVLGLGETVGAGYAEARAAAGRPLPTGGTVTVAVAEPELRDIVPPVRELAGLGFQIRADPTTATTLRRHGVDCDPADPTADLVITTTRCLRITAEAIAAVCRAEPGTPPLPVPRMTLLAR